MTDSFGWIASPDEDNDGWYDFNTDCHWTIEVDPSKAILFQILYVWTDPYQKQDGNVLYGNILNSGSHNHRKYSVSLGDKRETCIDKLVVSHKLHV